MNVKTYTMEEANGLLDYQAPELLELKLGLAFGTGMGIDEESPEINNSGLEVFGADGEDEEENDTFSLDD